jgi:hypothetical protein
VSFQIARSLLDETFGHFRACGRGARECQTLWISDWVAPTRITSVVHPHHLAHGGGFELDTDWLHKFFLELAATNHGIRVQIHTHPRQAFHSSVDDRYPIIHSAGFLSLVIPDFGLGPIGFEQAYLAEITPSGGWREVPIPKYLEVTS